MGFWDVRNSIADAILRQVEAGISSRTLVPFFRHVPSMLSLTILSFICAVISPFITGDAITLLFSLSSMLFHGLVHAIVLILFNRLYDREFQGSRRTKKATPVGFFWGFGYSIYITFFLCAFLIRALGYTSFFNRHHSHWISAPAAVCAVLELSVRLSMFLVALRLRSVGGDFTEITQIPAREEIRSTTEALPRRKMNIDFTHGPARLQILLADNVILQRKS